MLVLNRTLAALGDDMVYRGDLFKRLVDLFGTPKAAWGMALAATAFFFSPTHVWQGVSGTSDSGIMGVLHGLLDLAPDGTCGCQSSRTG